MGDLKKFSKLQVDTKKQSSGGVLWKDVLKNFANLTEKRLSWSPFFNKAACGNLKLSEAATGNVLLKKVFLKRCTGVSEPAVHTSSTQNRCFEQFTKFAANYLCWSLFLIKLQFWGPATLLKKTWNLQTF